MFGAKYDSSQGAHSLVDFEYLPRSQAVQAVLPSPLAYSPAKQLSQVGYLSPDHFPGSHAVHLADELPL